MTPRERFIKTLNFEKPDDRLPMVEWAAWWDQTLDRWKQEGLPQDITWDASLEHFGLDFLTQLMHDSLARAYDFADWVAAQDACELLSPPQLNIVCFRYVPPGWDPVTRATDINHLNQTIHARLSVEGPGIISIPLHRGRRWLRLVILHPLARRERLREILARVVALGRSISAAKGPCSDFCTDP